jgi:hypothetical protein
MQIYYDYDNQWRINATGTRNLSNPIIRYRQQPTVDFYFKTVAGSTVTAVDVSSAVSWEAAIDKDKSISTAPMCRTLSADIIATDAANGHIQIPLDAKTSQFLAAVNNVPTGIDVYFELKGYDVDDKQLHYAQCLFRAEMLVDAPGSPDPEVPDNYITEAQAAALLVAKEAALGNPTEDGMILSSTIAGVRTWIVAPTGTGGGSVWLYGEVDPTTEGENGYFYLNNVTGDVFYKSAGAWSAAILRIKGTDGEDGITYYPYFAYASDGSGTGFSLTPSSSLKYMAMIVSDAPITSPDIDDFSEAVWVKYIGDDGTGGTGSGSTWLHGESDPSTEGVEGDYYLNTTSGDIFCKGESTWGTAIMNINPTDGEDGADGQTFSATFPAATDYTLALTDAGTEISKLQVATNSIIIPTHAAVAFPTGTVIDVIGNPDCEINTSSITLAGGSEDGVFAEENQLKRLTKTDTNTWLITNLFGGSYSLPTASGSTLGGVKIGSGITITDGVISASGWSFYRPAIEFPQDWKESVWTNPASYRPVIDYDQLSVPVWRVDYNIKEGMGIFVLDKLPAGYTNLTVEITAQPYSSGATGTDMAFSLDYVRYRSNTAQTSIATVTALGATAFQGTGVTQATYTVSFSTLSSQAGDQLGIVIYPNTAASNRKQTDWMILSIKFGVS